VSLGASAGFAAGGREKRRADPGIRTPSSALTTAPEGSHLIYACELIQTG